jgi:PEP-CTERM motif
VSILFLLGTDGRVQARSETYRFGSASADPVPEPGTILLAGSGALALLRLSTNSGRVTGAACAIGLKANTFFNDPFARAVPWRSSLAVPTSEGGCQLLTGSDLDLRRSDPDLPALGRLATGTM